MSYRPRQETHSRFRENVHCLTTPIIVGLATTWLWSWSAALSSAQTYPDITLAPGREAPDGPPEGFDNPIKARDGNVGTFSKAGVSRQCKANGCSAPIATKQTTWDGVPDGYRPKLIRVNWRAIVAGQIHAGSTTRATAQLEYNAGNGWQDLPNGKKVWDSPTGSETYNPPNDGWATASIDPDSVSSGQIQVRATVKAELVTCTTQCGQYNPTSVLPTMEVFEIEIKAEPPILTVAPDPVTRGSEATFTVQGAPGATISNWVYTTTSHGTITRATGTGDATWPGIVVAAGTASVRVVLNGFTYELSNQLGVSARDWTWIPVAPNQVPNGTFVTLSSPPVPGGALGRMELDQPYSYDWAEIGDDGPNQGVKYLTAAANLATFRYQISPDLEDSDSDFYQAQWGDYSQQNQNGCISGAQLLSNTREHEFGGTRGHYQQYGESQANPSNNVGVGAEMQLAGPSTSVETFRATVENTLNARTGVILADTLVEACNGDVRYDTSCTFRGYINFAPYGSCQ